MDRIGKGKLGKPFHNQRWERTHALLTKAYLEIVKETGATPRLKDLKEKTGVTIPKISAHLKELDIETITFGSPHKLLANNVIMGLASKGASGDAFSAKLYFQLMYGFREKTGVDLSNKDGSLKSSLPMITVVNKETEELLKKVLNGEREGNESDENDVSVRPES